MFARIKIHAFSMHMTRIKTQNIFLFELNGWLLDEDRTDVKRLQFGTREMRNPALCDDRRLLLMKVKKNV